MHRYSIKPEQVKTTEAVRFNTHWMPAILTEIIMNVDEAIESISNDNPDVKVFTDGSEMEQRIEASVALYRNGNLKTTL